MYNINWYCSLYLGSYLLCIMSGFRPRDMVFPFRFSKTALVPTCRCALDIT